MVTEAIRSVLRVDATIPLCEHLQAISGLETCNGSAWKEPGVGACNHGADQMPHPKSPRVLASDVWGDHDSFAYVDTHPVDGSNASKLYHVAFRRYADHLAGLCGLVHVMYVDRPSVLAAASKGDAYGVSRELRVTGYYEGFGPDQNARILNHFRAQSSWLLLIRRALAGEAAPDSVLPCRLDLVHAEFGWQDMMDRLGMEWERDQSVLETSDGTT